jgi:8-oxo-dGTP diphosphatase
MKGTDVSEQQFLRVVAAADSSEGSGFGGAAPADGASTGGRYAGGERVRSVVSGESGAAGPVRQATLIDRSIQLGYKLAYRMMRVYWRVRRPSTHGALVTLWHQGELLLVQNSYVSYRSLPGGYVGAHETGPEAAVRELREEIGISATTDQLEKVFDEVKDWEGKRDHVEIFALELQGRPEIRIDHREVIAANWFSPEQALALELFPPIRKILEQRARAARGG